MPTDPVAVALQDETVVAFVERAGAMAILMIANNTIREGRRSLFTTS